ncbi:surface protein [Eubacterium ruminantium]|nr:surface protein [Eubacterium ruminantium]
MKEKRILRRGTSRKITAMVMLAAFVFAGVFANINKKAEAANYWYQDYEYELKDGKMILKEYQGSDTELTVPGTVTVKGVKYKVALNKAYMGLEPWTPEDPEIDDEDPCIDAWTGIWSFTGVKKLTISSGVIFPANCTGLLANIRNCEQIIINGANTASVKKMESMFENNYALQKITLKGIKTSKVTNVKYMFHGCYNLKNIIFDSFDTSSITEMNGMFEYCYSLQKLDLSNFNLGKVTSPDSCKYVFYNCYALDEIESPLKLSVNIDLPADYHYVYCDDPDDYDDERYESLPQNWLTSLHLTRYSPTFVKQPADVKVIRGSKAKFSVTVQQPWSGAENCLYKWEVSCDGGKTWENSKASGYNTDTVSMTSTKSLNGRMYRCRVTDTKGVMIQSFPAKLTTLPVVSVQPVDQTVKAGTKVKISLKSRSTVATYLWQVSTDGGKTWKKSGADGQGTTEITFTSSKKQNGYKYRCIVKNGTWEEKTSIVTLTVK